MPVISSDLKDYADTYNAGDPVEVGAGLSNPNIYASDAYAQKKIKKILLGSLCEWSYGGAEHDRAPSVLVFSNGMVPAYNVVMGINLNYVPPPIRRAIMKFVIESNAQRIRNDQPMIVTYDMLKNKFKEVRAITRMYKQILIGNPEVIPLSEWQRVARETGRWNNHYKILKG